MGRRWFGARVAGRGALGVGPRLAGAAGLVLLAVFMLYTRPDFLLTLANELWACF